jgi:hypothetical protein
MGLLPQTTFKTNERIATGTILLRDSDVVINCDTLTGSCTVYLDEFVSNYWNNQYKLYINDASANASVNNITILAPTGYTINNASSVVLNVNSATAIVRISSDGKYTATTNYCCGGGSSKEMSYYVGDTTYVSEIVPANNNKSIDSGLSIITSNETSLTGTKYLVNVICNKIRILSPTDNNGSLYMILQVYDELNVLQDTYISQTLLFSDYSSGGNQLSMHINYVPSVLVKNNYTMKVFFNCASIGNNVTVKYESSKLQISALRLALL